MRITVMDGYDVIFDGDAEEFLEANEYDEDIEIVLNELDDRPIGSKISYYGNQCAEYVIEKLEENIWED